MRECPVTLLWLIEYGWKIVDFKNYSVRGWEDEEMLQLLVIEWVRMLEAKGKWIHDTWLEKIMAWNDKMVIEIWARSWLNTVHSSSLLTTESTEWKYELYL